MPVSHKIKILRRVELPSLGVVAILAFAAWAGCGDGTTKTPPETRWDNVKEILHGVEIADPFRWLEDQQSRETREWID